MNRTKISWLLTILAVILLALTVGCEHQQASAGTSGKPAAAPTADPSVNEGDQGSEAASNSNDATPNPPASTTPEPSKAASASESNATETAVTSIKFISPTEGWAGGDGVVLHTKDGGVQWEKQYQGPGQIEAFSFIDNSKGWAFVRTGGASGDSGSTNSKVQGRLLQTTNGGALWSVVSQSAPISKSIRFISDQEGFSGNQYTSDGGKTWTALSVPANIKGEPFFISKSQGWAVTMKEPNYQVQLTKDGGKTWKPVWTHSTVSQVTNAVIRSTETSDAWVLLIGETGMNQTSYTLLHSKDEGKNWKTVVANSTAGGGPAPGYKIGEQPGPKGPGTKPGQLNAVSSDVAFLIGECAPCGDNGAVTVGSTQDGGISWVNGSQQLPGLNANASFLDGKNGWIMVGSYNQPSKLYQTVDSGKKWTQVQTFGKPSS
ncbi:hypothetical protein [Paenibacillus sp. UNC451MF]|uniref:hypothetical protein n=1 Tax=Paenibacillus sp. UNC451MF TaxID=1449063 RepID=UPI00049217BA|nr:hypothetical protein [Paenibacillus sp. UNC451MF]